jgi:hypothetical protein
MKQIWTQMHLKPHNRNLKILTDEECYNAAVNDKEQTLLIVPSLQTETEKEAERAMLWIPHSGKVFSWDEPPKAGPQKIWTIREVFLTYFREIGEVQP